MVIKLPIREEQVLLLLMEGKTRSEAAVELGLAVHTVKNIVSTMLLRLRAKNAVHAVVVALREGYITLDTQRVTFDPNYHNTGKWRSKAGAKYDSSRRAHR